MIPIPDGRLSEGGNVCQRAPESVERHTDVRSSGTDGCPYALKSFFLHLSRPEAINVQEADSMYVPEKGCRRHRAITLPAQSKY